MARQLAPGGWGLPTDAAAQVASCRPDLLAALGFDGPPRTFAEVIELGEAARKAGKWLGLPDVQSAAVCLVATLAADLGPPISPNSDELLPTEIFKSGSAFRPMAMNPVAQGLTVRAADRCLEAQDSQARTPDLRATVGAFSAG